MENLNHFYILFLHNEWSMQGFSDHVWNGRNEIIKRMKEIRSLVESNFDQPLRTKILNTGNDIKEAYFHFLEQLEKLQILMGNVVNFAHKIQPMQIWREPVSNIRCT